MALSVATIPAQPLLSKSSVPNAHATVSPAPAGPRYSFSAALMALAVCAHACVSAATVAPATRAVSQLTVPLATPVDASHLSSTRFSMPTCAGQLYALRTATKLGDESTQ